MVGEVESVDVLGVRVACRGARSRGDRRGKIEMDPKRRSLRHDTSNLVLETVGENRELGEDTVLIGLRWLACEAEELPTFPMSAADARV